MTDMNQPVISLLIMIGHCKNDEISELTCNPQYICVLHKAYFTAACVTVYSDSETIAKIRNELCAMISMYAWTTCQLTYSQSIGLLTVLLLVGVQSSIACKTL